MVLGIGFSVAPIGEQPDNLEAIRRAAAYQDCHRHRVTTVLYCLHNGLNRDSWPIIGGYFPRPRCDSLAPSDSGKTDGQMQQSRGAAAENCVALEDTGGAAPTHPDGVVA